MKDPYIAILSLGQPGYVTTFQFDVPFEVLSSGGGYWGGGKITTNNATVLTGLEGNGVIRFEGTFSSITFTNPVAENWYGFTVGLGDSP